MMMHWSVTRRVMTALSLFAYERLTAIETQALAVFSEKAGNMVNLRPA